MDAVTIHHFDHDTGEYFSSGPARLSPLDAAQGREVWLVPARATLLEPPAPGADQAAVFDGAAWALAPDFRGREIWDADTGESLGVVRQLGPLPEGATLEEPVAEPET